MVEDCEQYPTLFKWVHLSCAFWIKEIVLPSKAPVRIIKVEEKKFKIYCPLCQSSVGGTVSCQTKSCLLAFHPECARRSGLTMNYDRESSDKEIFC